jgi:pimeloyl-ACP methyl ester carboxylesterase
VEEHGAGLATPALLAHGLGGNRDVWSRVVDSLARDRRVAAYDLRGHGLSSRDLDDYSLERHARDLLAVRRAVSPDGPPHLVAASLSGVAAQIVAAEEPGTFRSLVLMATWAAARDTLDGEALARAVAEARDVRSFYQDFLASVESPDREEIAERIAGCDRGALVQGTRELFAYDGRHRLAAIEVPVLVITGERERYFPVEAGRELAAGLPRGRFLTIPGVAHHPQRQNPEAFAEAVRAFWREVESSPNPTA